MSCEFGISNARSDVGERRLNFRFEGRHVPYRCWSLNMGASNMDLRKSLILAAMTVFVSVACGRAADESAEAGAALAAAEAEAEEGGSRAGQLFYEYELAPLAAEVEFAPDFDSKVVLSRSATRWRGRRSSRRT
jgi:hypothetical protein